LKVSPPSQTAEPSRGPCPSYGVSGLPGSPPTSTPDRSLLVLPFNAHPGLWRPRERASRVPAYVLGDCRPKGIAPAGLERDATWRGNARPGATTAARRPIRSASRPPLWPDHSLNILSHVGHGRSAGRT
jgi:hypothetical protein